MFTEINVNGWAVVAATLAAYGLGAFWYGPYMFAQEWQKLMGKSEKELKEGPATAYGVAFVSFLVMAYVLAHFIELVGALTWQSGLITGFWVGIGFLATSHLINNVFGGRSTRLYLIDVGYQVAALLLMGAILGAWQ